MPTISKITLPSGNTYDIADDYARQILAGGLTFEICWDGQSAPDITKIPQGVKVKYNDLEYTGTKSAAAAEPFTFYLVYSPTQEGENDHYDEYAVIRTGEGSIPHPWVYYWERIGDTRIDLSDLGNMAYHDLSDVVATASGGSYTPASTSKKLTTQTINEASFTMGTGVDSETLIISLTGKTAATGGLSSTDASTNVGSTIVESVDAGSFVQPTVGLAYNE